VDPDGPRREDDYRQFDSHSKWNTPVELNRFDGTCIIEWLEDCEFYFDLYNIVEP
jgi:hypothetical protein